MMMSSHNNNNNNNNNGGESSGSSSYAGEFEIARVLASLRKHDSAAAAVAVEEMRGTSGGVESAGQSGGGGNTNTNSWGSKGKRWMTSNNNNNNKRVKESSSSEPSSVSPLPFDLNLDQPTIYQEEYQSLDVKAEKSCESSEYGRVCNSAHNTGRSRHNLTEAEKEARRIRRILANRESARHTIRRRQAFHEELTRKAAELASENERLKRNKELAVKEFQSLQTTNQKLKGQLSQTLGFKLGENKGEEAQPSCPNTHKPHSNNWAAQFVYKNLSATPYVFPTACLSPSDTNLSDLSPCRFIEQENFPSINGQHMPWCILPCPVFLPVHDIKNFSSLHIKDRDEGASVDSNHVHSPSSDYSPSLVIRCIRNCQLVSPSDRISSGLSLIQDDCRNGFHRFPFGFSLDGGGGQKMVPCCSRGDFALEREDCVTPRTRVNTNISSAMYIETVSTLPEKRKERVLKKRERNVAGAEARKKRKELMKLKSHLHFQLIG